MVRLILSFSLMQVYVKFARMIKRHADIEVTHAADPFHQGQRR